MFPPTPPPRRLFCNRKQREWTCATQIVTDFSGGFLVFCRLVQLFGWTNQLFDRARFLQQHRVPDLPAPDGRDLNPYPVRKLSPRNGVRPGRVLPSRRERRNVLLLSGCTLTWVLRKTCPKIPSHLRKISFPDVTLTLNTSFSYSVLLTPRFVPRELKKNLRLWIFLSWMTCPFLGQEETILNWDDLERVFVLLSRKYNVARTNSATNNFFSHVPRTSAVYCVIPVNTTVHVPAKINILIPSSTKSLF